MDSVPVWVLTAVIEISLLCTGALGLAAALLWRGQQRLRRQLLQLQEDTTPLAEDNAIPHVTAEKAPGTAAPEFPLPEEVVAVAPPAPESPQEAELSGILTQNMLDDALLALGSEDMSTAHTQEQEPEVSEAAQSVATMFAEHATMEQQIHHMQEKNGQLRQTIEGLLANVNLPLEEQQEIKVPEQTMQEIEDGLAALQHTSQRMLQQLQAHCQVLEIDDPGQHGAGARGDDGTAVPGHEERTTPIRLQEEVHHLKTAMEQQAGDFRRVQEEYDLLLVEYQRVFEKSATGQ